MRMEACDASQLQAPLQKTAVSQSLRRVVEIHICGAPLPAAGCFWNLTLASNAAMER